MTQTTSTFTPPPLTNETLESRLETGAHGSRASLTKCAVRYRSFLDKIHHAQNVDESKHLLETELQLYKVEFTKLALRVTASQQELEDLKQESRELQDVIAAKKKQVELLEKDVKKIKQVRGYKEEYKALAKMANNRPSRAIL